MAGLDAPEVVVDAFHVVWLGNTVVDEVRCRMQAGANDPPLEDRGAGL